MFPPSGTKFSKLKQDRVKGKISKKLRLKNWHPEYMPYSRMEFFLGKDIRGLFDSKS